MNARAEAACSPAAFEQRYQREPDPWHFATSPYEIARYEATLCALSRARYACAFEPGCSIGEFTALLAPICERVLASDASATAVTRARARCDAFGNVSVVQAILPRQLPQGPFDLIVFAEMGYYFRPRQLAALTGALFERLAPGGELLAVHWLGHSADHLLHGDEVARILTQTLAPRSVTTQRYDGFRIDAWGST